jgi:beta-glucosidase
MGCEVKGEDTGGFRDAIKAARESDVVVAVIGESADMSGEANCRSSLDLPGRQEELLKALHSLGKPLIMVLLNGRPMSFPWAAENVEAILAAWHPGTACGSAIAAILFGDFNPGGRLPVSFPRTVGQVPVHYNHRMTGRPEGPSGYTARYVDLPAAPQYPFGYGLGYSKFVYSDLRLSSARLSMTGKLTVSAVVRNAGRRDGAEVVQLYVRDVAGSTTRPVKELKGFEKIELKSGESRRVSFRICADDLKFPDSRMRWTAEPGEFKLWIAPDSTCGLEGSFKLGK